MNVELSEHDKNFGKLRMLTCFFVPGPLKMGVELSDFFVKHILKNVELSEHDQKNRKCRIK